MFRILAINPGSTSTKTACYEDDRLTFEKNIPFSDAERASFADILDQLDRRFELVAEALEAAGVGSASFDAVVGRGGLLAPVQSGTYLVSEDMKNYLVKAPNGSHAANLGAFIADGFAALSGCPAYIVDPVSVDELSDVARITGAPEVKRLCLAHALNHKAVSRKVAARLGKKYEECRFVVAHLGTGITLAAHQNGKMIDICGAKENGPMSPERAGELPADGLVKLCFSGRYTQAEIEKKLLSGWGLVAYLGTRDLREVFKMAERDEKARVVLDAFVYQIAKGVGSLTAALDGDIDAVILTGGMAYSERFVEMLTKKIKFLGPIAVEPGEDEMEALALGALRVLRKEERPRKYPTGEFL